MIIVRNLFEGERLEAVKILTASFLLDEFQMGLLPDDGSQELRLIKYFTHRIHEAFDDDFHVLAEVAVEDGANHPLAIALWYPPRQANNRPSMVRDERFYNEIFGDKANLAFQVDDLCDAAAPTFPVWHLAYIGTLPEAQGKGAASTLIRHRQNQAEDDGIPLYLESSSLENVAFYQRFGFQVLDTLPKIGAVALTTMLSKPETDRA